MSLFKKKADLLDNNVEVVTPIKDYNYLVSCFDDLTQTRLNSIDMTLEVKKSQFHDWGVTLTELDCTNDIILIKRNQNGYYPDESRSLLSNDQYDNYEISKDFYLEHIEDFEIVHNLLIDKEEILKGCYIVRDGFEEDVEKLINEMEYGIARKKAIYESDPVHPSKEYENVLKLMEDVKDPKNKDRIISEVMAKIRSCYSNEVDIRIKYIEDKYDITQDDAYGIILLNPKNGDKHMLYSINGYTIEKDFYENYKIKNNSYLEVYFKIIARCIKTHYESRKK